MKYLERLFSEPDCKNSPPQDQFGVPDLTEKEVKQRIQTWIFPYSVSGLSSENFRRLAWAVGKVVDLEVSQYWFGAKAAAWCILNPHRSYMGERFHAIYNAEGDMTEEASEDLPTFLDLSEKVQCEGDLEKLITKTESKLTWLEEWVFYFEFIYGSVHSRWQGFEEAWKCSQPPLRMVLKTKLKLALTCRSRWPDLGSHLHYCFFRHHCLLR